MAHEDFTKEWLEFQGFVVNDDLGLVKTLASGPGDNEITMVVSNSWPANTPALSIYVGEFGIVTRAWGRDDVLTLLRLFDGCFMDHPYEMDVDADELNEDESDEDQPSL